MFVTTGLTFHEEISKLRDSFHMNGYPKEISYNHVRKFLSEILMTTTSCQNMNDEKKYTVAMPFIGHPSIILIGSSTKNLKCISKNVVQYIENLKFKITFP